MFGNLGFGEMMVIMVIVLVLFGAKRVPEISASFGKGIREFKRNLNDVEGSIMDAGQSSSLPSSSIGAARPAPAYDDTPSEPKRLL
ncbi:MAG: twin-arginine translocase TatA/TatE family subunit [bacterium]